MKNTGLFCIHQKTIVKLHKQYMDIKSIVTYSILLKSSPVDAVYIM